MSLPALLSHTLDKCVFYQSAPVFLPLPQHLFKMKDVQKEECQLTNIYLKFMQREV